VVDTSNRWTRPTGRDSAFVKPLKSITFHPWTASCFIARQVAATLPGKTNMLITIAVVLVLLWVLGFVTASTMGGLIHILLVLAVVMVLIRVIQGKKILE
jgi:hypothetical protein